MTVIAAALLAGLAVLAAPRHIAGAGRRRGRVRLAQLVPGPGDPGNSWRAHRGPDRSLARRSASAVVGLSTVLLIGGPAGVLAGVLTVVVLDNALARLEPASVRRRRDLLAAELPVATDLLAACLIAGASQTDAVNAVSDALGGPVADELRAATARIQLGADPAAVWRSLALASPLAPLGRALARAADSGAPLAETLTRMADEQRAARRRAAFAAAQRIGVWAAAPLGLCFLPAFVLLGVVPLIAGILNRVLSV